MQDKLLTFKTAVAGLRDVGTWALGQSVSSTDDAHVSARRLGGVAPAATGPGAVARPLRAAQLRVRAAGRRRRDHDRRHDDLAEGRRDARRGGRGDQPDDRLAVFAVNVSGRLVLSARATGAASTFTATGGALTEDPAALRAAAAARYSIDGGGVQTSATNVVTDVIAGVELTFKGVTAGSASIAIGPPAVDGIAVKQLQDSMAREDTRLAAVQMRLKAQFAAMEAAMANAQEPADLAHRPAQRARRSVAHPQPST